MPQGPAIIDPLTQQADLAVQPADGLCVSQHHVSSLLHELDDAATASGLTCRQIQPSSQERCLIEARLGIASGLFTALRCKHRPTADHCLRVAIGCSSWAAYKQLPEEDRDSLEVAALLHDIGKIGVPDHILHKPGRLFPEEAEIMASQRQMGLSIVAGCSASANVLEAIAHSGTWFDGSHAEGALQGDQLPLAARMLSIVDAYDSMTIDHVYRPAKSRERALNELVEFAGTQFDPQLVQSFCELFVQDQNQITEAVTHRWFMDLPQGRSQLPWQMEPQIPLASEEQESHHQVFEEKLIDNMHDGVVFVDNQSNIFLWNTGAERLTGVSAAAASGRVILPSLLDMCEESGKFLRDAECPIAQAISTGVQVIQRVGIIGREGQRIYVDMHVIPVRCQRNILLGATILLHDASSETSLEEKCQALYSQVTKDPMTQVANRAEFDRMQSLFIETHEESSLPCSLIMIDIDHFKSVNDTYGHQAGDEAIIAMASLLKSMCRSGDLVARYGGEEFAVLCAGCSNAAAAQRAESIRKKLSEISFSFLGNRCITASFGVTELQTGDTPETMLRRADRGLLQAKDQGRNQVVQLGVGMDKEQKKSSWWGFAPWRGNALVNVKLVTAVPLDIAVQKLRGFIADHEAKLLKTEVNHLRLEINSARGLKSRRQGDRSQSFIVDLQFSEEHVERSNSQGLASGAYVQTSMQVSISPKRDRDRRRDNTTDRARMIFGSLKSYLMAQEGSLDNQQSEESMVTEAL